VAYPNTSFSQGIVDDPFGGQPANAFGTPMRAFIDAQIQELQKQVQDAWWSGRPVQHLAIQLGGIAGDTIVFDSAQALIDGGPAYRTLASNGYTQDETPIVGWLVEPVSAAATGRVMLGGGVLPASITGLSGTSKGPITVDFTTGRLRALVAGETTYGYCDGNGNVYMLYPGFIP
jgi:hypothetical protein